MDSQAGLPPRLQREAATSLSSLDSAGGLLTPLPNTERDQWSDRKRVRSHVFLGTADRAPYADPRRSANPRRAPLPPPANPPSARRAPTTTGTNPGCPP